jgi:hypothetical protein
MRRPVYLRDVERAVLNGMREELKTAVDRAALFGSGRSGLALHPEESQNIVLRLSFRIRRR